MIISPTALSDRSAFARDSFHVRKRASRDETLLLAVRDAVSSGLAAEMAEYDVFAYGDSWIMYWYVSACNGNNAVSKMMESAIAADTSCLVRFLFIRIAPCLSVVFQKGYFPGKIAGRVGNAVNGCGLVARIVKHGQQFRTVLV